MYERVRSKLSPLCTLTPCPGAHTDVPPKRAAWRCPPRQHLLLPGGQCQTSPEVPRSAGVLKRDNELGCFSYQDCLYFSGRLVNSKQSSQLAGVKLAVKFKAHNRTLRTDVFQAREMLSFSLKSCILSATAVYENPCLTQNYSI